VFFSIPPGFKALSTTSMQTFNQVPEVQALLSLSKSSAWQWWPTKYIGGGGAF
jgi:hypothetical protein